MDSLDFQNIYGNQGALRIQQSCNENSREYDGIDLMNDTSLSINNDSKSRVFIGPNSDDDDRYKFFMVCAENKINALIERVREFSDNFERPEEFENEAVSMAIQQHGLRKNDTRSISYGYDNESKLNSSNTKSLSTTNVDVPTTSNNISAIVDDDDKRKIKKKRHEECTDNKNNDAEKEGFDVDDMYFLNEAVAAAIEQKGLCSSSFGVLK